MRILGRLTLVACLCALASAPAAAAKAPPTGKYDCVIGANSILFGTLTIKRDARYTHRGTSGSFTTEARRLRFKRGSLGGMRGRWYRTTTQPEIALRNPRDDFESIYCTKR